MDLAVAWYQEEQEGEAKRIWSNIWETNEMEFQQQLLQQQQANNGNNSDTKSNDSNPTEKVFNPTRRKGSTNDNKASTYNMNKYQAKLVGKHGGCPWRCSNFPYARGIIGWVFYACESSLNQFHWWSFSNVIGAGAAARYKNLHKRTQPIRNVLNRCGLWHWKCESSFSASKLEFNCFNALTHTPPTITSPKDFRFHWRASKRMISYQLTRTIEHRCKPLR